MQVGRIAPQVGLKVSYPLAVGHKPKKDNTHTSNDAAVPRELTSTIFSIFQFVRCHTYIHVLSVCNIAMSI